MRLEDFYSQLQVDLTLRPLAEAQLAQVAYLTERTAEFHLTGQVSTADALAALLATDHGAGWLIEVRDRFGDYGVSGAAVVSFVAPEATVESWVLSCRVMGKQVEDRVLERLLQSAAEHGCERLVLRYRRTARNGPAAAFVRRLGGPQLETTDDGYRAVIAVDRSGTPLVPAATPDSPIIRPVRSAAVGAISAPRPAAGAAQLVAQRWERMVPEARAALLSEITTELHSGEQIAARLRARRRRARHDLPQVFVAPRSELERGIAAIWQELLGVAQVGVDDDFFALGGHSLLATQVVSRLRSSYGVELPLRALFEQPTVARLARMIEAERGTTADHAPIPQADRSEPLPLSFAQRRLWFLDQLQPGNPAYNIPTAVRLDGSLDRAALQAALDQLVARHESLRTTFAQTADEPVQRIVPSLRVALRTVDLREHSPDRREAEALRLAQAATQQPFDLRHGPLLRALLLQLDADQHLLLLVLHHIVGDGWSLGVLAEELAVSYRAAQDEPSTLAVPSVQYADYAVWQRDHLQGETLRQQIDYWRTALADAPATLDLPTDRPRPGLPTLRGARHSFTVARPLADALQVLSQRAGATLFMTLLAAWATLLGRYSGQAELLIGTPIASRSRRELERVIGLFANTLVLRVPLAADRPFLALLDDVREVCLGAYAHQDVPFEQLVDLLQPARDLSRNPLFQVLFVLQNTPVAPLSLPGLSFSPLRLDSGTAKFELSLAFVEGADGLEGALEYSTDLFDATTIARMAGQLQTLLRGIVATPEQPLAELPWLTPAERDQLLVQWNATDVRYPEQHSLAQLIEAQVARSPDAAALVFESRALSYRELNRRANRLAHQLRRLGVGPDTLVGVCMERSLELVIALLGVLKAGGAYVPLDPSYPAERLQFMFEDAQVGVLLTQPRLQPRLPRYNGTLLCLDAELSALPEEPESDLAVELHADNLAYMIYTSGSTGRPKGALNTHGAICNRLLWMQAHYQLQADDRVLQKTPFSFDVSVWEFFWPLLAGATLVIARPGGHHDPAYLARLIRDERITTVHFVPSMLQLFLQEPELEQLGSLRWVICSGEALPFALQQRFFSRIEAELHNLYGPTEAAVDVTAWACERNTTDADERPVVPIGRPIANTQVYVVDRALRPVPVGVPGELLLGGVQLARGYHRRPALTAEKFIPSPFGEPRTQNREQRTDRGEQRNNGAEEQGFNLGPEGTPSPADARTRLYRTGDLVRWLPDGTLEFLGRIDHQVKLRGLRIELGEIEALLRQHPAVRDAVVTVRDDGQGQRLVAYVVGGERVPSGQTESTEQTERTACSLLSALCSPAELRAALAEHLPDYMIPSAFVMLDALPLTPNGKVDRRALPAPQADAGLRSRTRVAPRTAQEQRLARVWAELLGVEQLGVDDNFFELGGDSFRAIQLVQRLDHAVAVVDVLQHQTIRTLAALLEAGTPAERTMLYRLSGPPDPRVTLVCVPYGGGSAIAYQPLSQALPPDYALYAVELPGHDLRRRDEPLESVAATARRCVSAIQRTVDGPVVLYGHCVGVAVTLEIARLLQAAGTPARAVFLAGAMPPQPRGRFGFSLARVSLLNKAVPDTMIHAYLKRLGGFDGTLQAAELQQVMELFRHDGLRSLEYFEQLAEPTAAEKLQAPLFCIVGDKDPLTRDFARRFRSWRRFAKQVELAVIGGGGHYFVKHQARELGQLIARLLDDTL